MKTMLKAVARRTPYLQRVFHQRDELTVWLDATAKQRDDLHHQLERTLALQGTYPAAPASDGVLPYPPQHLAYRVIGNDNLPAFLFSGMRCASDLAFALAQVGKAMCDFQDIYDFGVGCGRLIRWLPGLAPQARFYGSDTDAEAIAWCKENLPFGRFAVNPPLPKTCWEDGAFDLLYASSVFTHLDEARQHQWLGEVQRVLRPGGIALLTVHGPSTVPGLPENLRNDYARTGFIFRPPGDFWKGVFPDWYGNSNHSREYVAKVFGQYFKVHQHLDRGLANYQDIVVVERTA